MKSKIRSVLEIVSRRLMENDVAYALIGAMALALYGLPRYTSDIDILADGEDWEKISQVMDMLGYECFQKTEAFAQFDSPLGVYGKIDFMLVATEDGRKILSRRVWVEDRLFGNQPVVEPTDYVGLKLLAAANNPEREAQDEADIAAVFRAKEKGLISAKLGGFDTERLGIYAKRYGKIHILQKYMSRD